MRAVAVIASGPPVRRPGGFTLVEILLALLVAGTAALVAHGLFSAAVDGSSDLRAARSSLDRASNIRRFLGATFMSLETGADAADPFVGERDRVRFTAWLETPDGWFERRPVILALRADHFVASVGSEPPLVLADSVAELELDYLVTPGADAHWVGEWISPVSAPLAVRIRLTRQPTRGRAITDTTTYLIKARG